MYHTDNINKNSILIIVHSYGHIDNNVSGQVIYYVILYIIVFYLV